MVIILKELQCLEDFPAAGHTFPGQFFQLLRVCHKLFQHLVIILAGRERLQKIAHPQIGVAVTGTLVVQVDDIAVVEDVQHGFG